MTGSPKAWLALLQGHQRRHGLVKEPEEGPCRGREVSAVPVSDPEFDRGRSFKYADGLQRAVPELLNDGVPLDEAYTVVLPYKFLKKASA